MIQGNAVSYKTFEPIRSFIQHGEFRLAFSLAFPRPFLECSPQGVRESGLARTNANNSPGKYMKILEKKAITSRLSLSLTDLHFTVARQKRECGLTLIHPNPALQRQTTQTFSPFSPFFAASQHAPGSPKDGKTELLAASPGLRHCLLSAGLSFLHTKKTREPH